MSVTVVRTIPGERSPWLLVECSETFRAWGGGPVCYIPVQMPLTAHGLDEPLDMDVLDMECAVQRKNLEPITCHSCEVGHHIHIEWTP